MPASKLPRLSLARDLVSRGLVYDLTSRFLFRRLEKPVVFYLGIDATAPSLQVGHLLPLITALRLRSAGHSMIALVGSSTAFIGDPSGRMDERKAINTSDCKLNSASLANGIRRFFNNAEVEVSDRSQMGSLEVVENGSWLNKVTVVDFLRRVGPYARVQRMMSRDSFRGRMEAGSATFGELSYQLLQAYDFAHLYESRGCQLQIGGTDQWGNILAGTDLLHHADTEETNIFPVYGMTVPLLLNSAGTKFGKSTAETEPIWLDSEQTSSYQLYQAFRSTPDSEVELRLRQLTLLSIAEIGEIMAKQKENPKLCIAQKALSHYVTKLVHGAEGVEKAEFQTKLFFTKNAEELHACDTSRVLELFEKSELYANFPGSTTLLEAFLESNTCQSVQEACHFVKYGALYCNGSKVVNLSTKLEELDLIGGRLVLLRCGKRAVKIIDTLCPEVTLEQ